MNDIRKVVLALHRSKCIEALQAVYISPGTKMVELHNLRKVQDCGRGQCDEQS